MRTYLASAVAFFCLSIGLLCPSGMKAQGLFGTISGAVSDSSGAAVPGASVTVTNVDTNISKKLTTNGAGLYSADSLNPGTYRVEAGARGFKTAVAKGVLLEVGANPKVDLALTPGAVTETVEVTAFNTAIVQTQQSDLGQTVNQKNLDELPTVRNVFGGFLTLAAGVSQQKSCQGCGDNNNVRINGDRPRTQDYVLDGTTVVQPVFGGQALSPSVDSIQEFRIEQNSMSAEYGKAGGGVFIALTKGGTNTFHGSAYGYTQNRKLNARNYFDTNPTKNPFDNNDFGGTVGGPILKNKLFFFLDYEAIRSHGASPSLGNQVPDVAFRSGNLGALCTAAGGTFDGAGNCSSASGQIKDPVTQANVPFNQIPTGSLSTISQNLLAVWPTATAAGNVTGANTFNFNSPFSTSVNNLNPRVDYNPTSKDHIFGAFHRSGLLTKGYDIIVGPAGETGLQGPTYASTIGWTRTLSIAMLNDFRFGYMHRAIDRGANGQGHTSPTDFEFTGIPNCLASIPNSAGGAKCGTPQVAINSFAGLAGGETLYEPATTLQFSDIVTKLAGRHNIKTGAEFRHYSINNYQPNAVDGNFSFDGSQTGNAFSDFLFGSLARGGHVQVQNAYVSSRAWSYNLFVQDDFKVSAKLTLNLGLRWQYDQSFHEIHHGDAYYEPCAVVFTHGACTPHWEQFGVNAPDTTFDPSKKQFEPRVGFAWNPRGGFVVRGGYGIMHPGAIGHGRAGDGEPGPNLLANTQFNAGANWGNLGTITSPDPTQITALIPASYFPNYNPWAPRSQYPTYIQLWNFSVQQQLDSNTVAQIGYVGSHGVHLPINYGYNICQQSPTTTSWSNLSTTPYCPAAAASVVANGGNTFNLTVFPGYWGLSSSVYNSLQAQVDHRFSRSFSLLANFTWSKLLDDSSADWGGFWSLDVLGQDFYNREAERSVSAGDVPKRFTVAPVVELPFGHGKRWLNSGIGSEVLGGWRLSSIYTISSGSPFGITDNVYGYCSPARTITNRPNIIGNPLPSGFHQTVGPNGLWFDRSVMDFSGTCPAAGLTDLTGPSDPAKGFGDAPRYYSNIRNPVLNNFDFSVQKDFRIPVGEQTRLAFSADFFNLPNHPQFGEPVSDPLNTDFGRVLSTGPGNRIIQLGLHLYF